ncbi:MAG: sialidase [Proteobacteria bacterium]|nr:sialidase [Pseudomonadota bacterium]
MVPRRLIALCCLCFVVTAAPVCAAADFVFTPAIPFANVASMPLFDISRAGERLVAVGERGLIIVSDDDGQNWQQAAVPVSATLTAVSFPTPDKGWAVGHAGTILHSDDGGSSWQLQFDGNAVNEQYLAFTRVERERLQTEVDALQQSADSATAEASPSLLKEMERSLEDAVYAEEDAEQAMEGCPPDPFLDVLFVTADTGFAVGAYGMIYRTEDAGTSWHAGYAGIENIDRYHYYSLAQTEGGLLYLSGEAGLLYRSTDGGLSWERLESLYDGSLFGLLTQGEHVIAFGLRGNIFRSDDRGYAWSRLDNPAENGLYGGSILASGDVLLLGSGGLVLRAPSAGGAFRAFNDPTRTTFSAAIGGREGEVLAVGMNGVRPLEMKELRGDE